LPYITNSQATTQDPNFDTASLNFQKYTVAMTAYVKDLMQVSPTATIHLYCVDFFLGLIQSVLYANGVPDSQYTITVISDGSFSYAEFSSVYASSTPQSTHNTLESAWLAAKATSESTGSVPAGFTLAGPNNYLYAAVDAEPNAVWWLARKALLTTAGDNNAFGLVAQADPQVINVAMATLLANLTAQGPATVAAFKALYNFSDTYFQAAADNGKKVMLFLGTTVWAENGSFPDYARFIMEYYGNSYQYYYKGHPGTPTEFYPSKQDELARLGITDVDSSIPAELILFFHPTIYLSGYPSSTYASVTDPNMADGLFTMTQSAALANTTADYSMMDIFVAPVSSSTPKAEAALCRPQQRCFTVEPSAAESASKGYDIGIWEPDIDYTRYYKLVGGTYTLVSSHLGGSVVTLGTKLDSNKRLDIMAGSTAPMAMAQIWDSNDSPAQRYRLTNVGGNCYTIEEVESGLLLDVQYAGTSPGTRVWQYPGNGTAAQLWQMISTGDGDGSFYLQSKLSGLVLDIQYASDANGAPLQVWTLNGTAAQKFYSNTVTPVVSNGSHTLATALNTSLALDVQWAGTTAGTPLWLYTGNGTNAQKFQFAFDNFSGFYSIVNVNSGMAIDVPYASTTMGERLWQFTPNGTRAQEWTIKVTGGGVTITSALGTGYVMDVYCGLGAPGSPAWTWVPNGTKAQTWVIS